MNIRQTDETLHELDQLLRSCVECGLCLPSCATYLATGSEVQSPRGRLLLLEEILTGKIGADASGVAAAFDQCIGCRACVTACPSGVSFDLLEFAQESVAERAAPLPPGGHRLDRRPVLSLLRRGGGLGRRLLQLVAGGSWRRRLDGTPLGVGWLARSLGTLPRAPQGDEALLKLLRGLVTGPISPSPSAAAPPHPGAKGSEFAAGPRVAFFRGCANDRLLPGSARRLRQLLTASGCQVTIPAGQDCCGALAAHNHDPQRRQDLHRRNLEAFATTGTDTDVAPDIPSDIPPDAIVVEAAGCGLELRDYTEALAARVRDAVVLLGELPLPALAGLPLKVVIHDPCHARHGQGIVAEPRALLRRIPGLQLVEAEEAEVCCGSGGTYSLRHRSLAEAMGRRKAERLAASGADVIVTANPGCLGQIADGLALVAPDLPIIPLTDLIWASWRLNR